MRTQCNCLKCLMYHRTIRTMQRIILNASDIKANRHTDNLDNGNGPAIIKPSPLNRIQTKKCITSTFHSLFVVQKQRIKIPEPSYRAIRFILFFFSKIELCQFMRVNYFNKFELRLPFAVSIVLWTRCMGPCVCVSVCAVCADVQLDGLDDWIEFNNCVIMAMVRSFRFQSHIFLFLSIQSQFWTCLMAPAKPN